MGKTNPPVVPWGPAKKATWIATLALAGCQSADKQNTLDDYRWKKRVVLHQNASPDSLELSEAERAAFLDRDLVFVAAEDGLAKQFRLEGSDPVFVLIGKDGREKDRQNGSLDLGQWFRLIDTMPMRQSEMKK